MLSAKLKGFSRDTVLYGVGEALGRLIALVLLPILSRVFVPADYGVIDMLVVAYVFILTFSELGVPTGLQRHYFRVEGDERREMVTSCVANTVFVGVLLGGTFALLSPVLATKLGDDSAPVRMGILLLAYSLPFELLWGMLVLLLRLQRRAVTFSLMNVLRVLITPSMTYLLVVLRGEGIAGVFAAKAISLTTISLVLLFILRKEFQARFSFATYWRILRFAISGHPGMLMHNAMTILPRYILAFYAPLTAVGLFGVAYRISTAMRIYIGAFNRAWNPFAYSNEGSPEEPRIYEVVFKMFFVSLVLLITSLGVLASDLLAILTPEKYHSAAGYVAGLASYLGIEGLVVVFSTLLYTRGRVAWFSYLSALRLFLFVTLSLVLVPRYSITGLVISLNASAIVYAVAYAFAARRVFPFRVAWGSLGAYAVLGATLLAAFSQVELEIGLRLALKLGSLLLFVLSAWRIVLDATERDRVRKMFGRRATA